MVTVFEGLDEITDGHVWLIVFTSALLPKSVECSHLDAVLEDLDILSRRSSLVESDDSVRHQNLLVDELIQPCLGVLK